MIKITVTGLDKLDATFANIDARLRAEMKEANKEVGQYLEDQTKRTFDISGPGWAPNSPSTIEKKGSSKPLIDTGGLRGGIKHKLNQSDISGEVFPAGPGYPRIHSQFLALVHDTPGTTVVTNGFGRGIEIRIPGRPFFLNTARRERKKVAAIYLKGLRRALGLGI